MKLLLGKLLNNRFVRYVISGGSATLVNLGVLFILVEFFNFWYLNAAIAAFVIAVCVSFLLQKFFTFNDYNKEKIKKQAPFYLSLQIFNVFVNTALMYLGVDFLNLPYLLSQIIISAAISFYNFFIYKHLVFKPDAIYN